MRFTLKGLSGAQPRVTGVTDIVPAVKDFTSDASGNISGTLYSTRDAAGTGNGEIEVNGSYTAAFYEMRIFRDGQPGPPVSLHAKNGVTLNITNVTPITTNPVVAAPTGDTTYARLDGGNQPFTAEIVSRGSVVGSGDPISFSSGATPSTVTADTFLSRLAAGIIGVGTAIGNALGTLRAAVFQAGDGSAAAPGLTFSALSTTGWFRNNSFNPQLTIAGTPGPQFTATAVWLGWTGALQWSASTADPNASARDTALTRYAIGGIAVGNGSSVGDFSGALKATTLIAAVHQFTAAADTGLSRTGIATVSVGNGTQGDVSGTIKAAVLNLNGNTLNGITGTGTAVVTNSGAVITGATLQGAASGNAITLLNSQGPSGALTGNSADQTVFTFSIPANTIGAGKGIRVTWGFISNNAVAVTYKLTLGSTNVVSRASGAAIQNVNSVNEIVNGAGVQNSQYAREMTIEGATITGNGLSSTAAENTANALTIKLTFNVASPNTVTPKFWLVELIQ